MKFTENRAPFNRDEKSKGPNSFRVLNAFW